MDMVGEGRIVASTPARCHDIAGTPACEDMWLDRSTGLSYLACMPHEWRQPWVPATLKVLLKQATHRLTGQLNATALPVLPSTGFFATFDTNTEKLTKLRVSGYPRSNEGLFLHGFDLLCVLLWKARASCAAMPREKNRNGNGVLLIRQCARRRQDGDALRDQSSPAGA